MSLALIGSDRVSRIEAEPRDPFAQSTARDVPALIKALKDIDANTRLSAARALCRLGPEATKEAADALVYALCQDDDPRVLGSVRHALSAIGAPAGARSAGSGNDAGRFPANPHSLAIAELRKGRNPTPAGTREPLRPPRLYTDAEAEVFAKRLKQLDREDRASIRSVIQRLGIDRTRIGPGRVRIGNATEWTDHQISRSYWITESRRVDGTKSVVIARTFVPNPPVEARQPGPGAEILPDAAVEDRLTAEDSAAAEADGSAKPRLVQVTEEVIPIPDTWDGPRRSQRFPGEWVVGGGGWLPCPECEHIVFEVGPRGPRVYVTVDGRRRLGGVIARDPEGLAALREEVAKGTSPLAIWPTVQHLDLLPPLPAGREYALALDDRSKMTNLAPVARLKNLRALWLGDTCRSVSDLKPLAGFTEIRSLHVSGIDARALDLSPLAGMTKMTVLDLTHCPGVTDLGPLKNMANLTLLDLRACGRLSDLTPLRGLDKLYRLRLSRCRALSDLSPLAGLTNLTHLELAYCEKVTDLSPLAGLTDLTYLELASCENVTNLSPLAGLTDLKTLHMRGLTKLTDLTPLAKLEKLGELRLNYCSNLSDITPLAGLTNLERLGLHGCAKLSDIGPLAGCKSLNVLSLGSPNVSDVTPLAGLTNLYWLHLERSKVSDLTPLSGLTNLQRLDLRRTPVADLAPLAKLPKLRLLELRECENVTDLAPIREMLRHREEGVPPGFFYFRVDVRVDDRLKSQLEKLRKDD